MSASSTSIVQSTTINSKDKQREQSHRPAPWKSLVAGAAAGAVEGFATYPFEYAKTIMQFTPTPSSNTTGVEKTSPRNPFSLIYTTVSRRGITALYTGCSSLVIGTGVKAAVRFLAFDSIKGRLQNENGKLTAGRGVLAGMGAGVFESVFAVTPFETIKTALIEDGKRDQPKYRGLSHGIKSLLRERGFNGVYKGLFAVTLRQSANSAVRMGSYSWLKGLAQARQVDAKANLNSTTTFGLGAIAGIITVYTTMPFDTVKTRMQSLSAKENYTSTFDCSSKILRHEGIRAFWSGSTARLARLIGWSITLNTTSQIARTQAKNTLLKFSGGIVFTIYKRVVDILGPI